jgi:hypothetical protein
VLSGAGRMFSVGECNIYTPHYTPSWLIVVTEYWNFVLAE